MNNLFCNSYFAEYDIAPPKIMVGEKVVGIDSDGRFSSVFTINFIANYNDIDAKYHSRATIKYAQENKTNDFLVAVGDSHSYPLCRVLKYVEKINNSK